MEISGFYVTQILREINFGEFRSPKTAIFAILRVLKFVNLMNFNLQKMQKFIKSKLRTFEIVKTSDFAFLESAKSISRKI